jgi:hypothetical protein
MLIYFHNLLATWSFKRKHGRNNSAADEPTMSG